MFIFIVKIPILKKARYHLWLNVIITLSRCLLKIGATNHALLAKNSDQKRVR